MAQACFHLTTVTKENCAWNLSAQSQDANLFHEMKLIIRDEITMAHWHIIEALKTGL
jgi:hypothetical protein